MQSGRPRVTLHTGSIVQEYGLFRLRTQFLLRDDDERRETGHYAIRLALGPDREEGITILDRRRGSLPGLVFTLRRYLQGLRGSISVRDAHLAQLLQPGALEELQVRLNAERAEEEEEAQESGHPPPSLRTAAELITGWQEDLERLRGQYDRLERALRELEAEHPDLEGEVQRVAEVVQAEEAETARLQAETARQTREWWNKPIERYPGGRQPDIELGDLVAQHGRFRVHAATRIIEDGARQLSAGYYIQLEPPPGGERMPELLAVGTFGRPYTPRVDRATTIQYLKRWMEELHLSIDLGQHALIQVQEPEIAARIQGGLAERERQYEAVERALRELENKSDGEGRQAPEG